MGAKEWSAVDLAALDLERVCEELRRMAAVLDAAGFDEDGPNPARQVEQMLLG